MTADAVASNTRAVVNIRQGMAMIAVKNPTSDRFIFNLLSLRSGEATDIAFDHGAVGFDSIYPPVVCGGWFQWAWLEDVVCLVSFELIGGTIRVSH